MGQIIQSRALILLPLILFIHSVCWGAAPPLRYWFWWPAPNFDTYYGDSFDVMQVARNIYAPLVSIGMNGRPQGMMAETWSVDRTGCIWRFKLRKGLKFEDGKEISPEIVLKNFRRLLWLTRGEQLPLNSLLPETIGWKNIATPLKSVYLSGGDLVFRFNRRPENLFEILSHPIYGIASPDCFDGEGRWKEPFCSIASGQYKIVERVPGRIRMVSRHMFPNAGNAPEEVEILTPKARGENAVKAMLDGQGDLAIQPGFAIGDVTLAKLRAEKFLFTEEPPSRMYFFQLNHLRPPFDDKAMRQSVRDVFLGLLAKDPYFIGRQKVDPSFLPKGGVGYAVLNAGSARKPLRAPGARVEVMFYPLATYNSEEDWRMQAAAEKAFISALKLHGMKPVVSRYSDRKTFRDRNVSMTFDALMRGSGVVTNDPYSGLKSMFMSKISALIPDPSGRAALYIEKAVESPDPLVKKEMLRKMNESVFDDAAVITFTHSNWVYIHKPDVDMSRFNLFMDPIEFRAIGWKQ